MNPQRPNFSQATTPDELRLHELVETGSHAEVVSFLRRFTALTPININCYDSFRFTNTPLMKVCQRDDWGERAAIAGALIDAGAANSYQEMEPLMHFGSAKAAPIVYAASSGKADVVRVMLERGCDDFNGQTLHLGLFHGHFGVAEAYVSAGRTTQVDLPSRNPLYDAVYTQHKVTRLIGISYVIDHFELEPLYYTSALSIAVDFKYERSAAFIAKRLPPTSLLDDDPLNSHPVTSLARRHARRREHPREVRVARCADPFRRPAHLARLAARHAARLPRARAHARPDSVRLEGPDRLSQAGPARRGAHHPRRVLRCLGDGMVVFTRLSRLSRRACAHLSMGICVLTCTNQDSSKRATRSRSC